jgi:hypothetical protein
MILDITRGHIRVSLAGKTASVGGEGYARGHGNPDFVIYRNTILAWDPPNQSEWIDEATKDLILADIIAGLVDRGMTVEVE